MLKTRMLMPFGLFVYLLAACASVLAQEPCTITVHPGESIQEAIDAAPEGAVLCLTEGTWTEVLTLTKSLTLRGAGASRTLIKPSRTGPIVVIRSEADKPIPHVVIEDLAIQGAKGFLAYGIALLYEAQATILRCAVSDCTWSGISLWHDARALISDCTLSDNHLAGLEIAFRSEAEVTWSEVTGNLVGIMVHGEAHGTITDCTIRSNWGDGIALLDQSVARLERNRIVANGVRGVTLMEEGCDWTGPAFAGLVSGWGNTIPSPGEADANARCGVCPDDLGFLLTTQGGELDRRK